MWQVVRIPSQPISALFLVQYLLILPLLLSSSLAADKDKAIRRSDQAAPAYQSYDVGSGIYALVVGVAKYRHPKISRLKVSDKDAEDFAEFLKKQNRLFREINVTLLTNEEATRSEVEKNLYISFGEQGKMIP